MGINTQYSRTYAIAAACRCLLWEILAKGGMSRLGKGLTDLLEASTWESVPGSEQFDVPPSVPHKE